MTQLKHGSSKKCGGILMVDASAGISLLTPSYSFKSSGEFTLGIVELTERKSAKFLDIFVCSKCTQTFAPDSDEISAMCNVCRKDRPVSKMFVSSAIAQICEGCMEYLQDPSKKTEDERIIEYRRFNSFPEKLIFVPMRRIMQSKFAL